MKKECMRNLSVAIGCLLGTVGALATIGETWYLGQIVGVLGEEGSEIWIYLAIVLGMVVLEYLSNTLGIWVKQMAQRKIVMDLRSQLFEKSVRIEYLQLKKRNSGDLNSLFLSDAEAIGKYYKVLMDSFGDIVGAVSALLVCTLISWKFLLISLCIFPIMLLLGTLVNKNLKKYAYEVQRKKGVTAAVLLDVIRNKNIAKSYSAQEYLIAHFTESAEAENQAVMREARKRGIAGAVNRISGSLPYIAIFIVGGALIFGGEIQIGEFFAFAYIFSNVQSIQNILEISMAAKNCAAARKRLDEFFLQPDAEDGQECGSFSEEDEGLYLCDVSFSYGGGPDIFRELNLHIKKGTTVGFVGESGSGKSTLLGLLTGLYVPQTGTVRYCCGDGCYEGSAYRERIAVVFQDNYVFPTTVRENLRIGKPDASEEEMLQACRDAGILEDIEKLPGGLDTGVSELGHSLSGGQRQRICIARALLRKPEILIMDEPSASLDTVHEALLMERMSSVMKEGILIVVSHRQSTIRQLQTVYCLENGVLRKAGEAR